MATDGTPAAPDLTATAADRWRRAAVVGGLWAASEIVLGSFLHNIRIPLRGHLLTLVAVGLLAATRRRWPMAGIAWRAGLVAAVMKSVSPSAVLLGPMIAITMEGVLFELGARFGRRGAAACMVGGAFAMSWTFLHQVASLLIAFGPDLVEVYTRLASAVPGVERAPLGSWIPLVGVLAVELAVGAAAGLVGWRAAGRAAAMPERPPVELPVPRRPLGPAPSLVVLGVLVVALPAGLVALARLPLAAAAATTLVAIALLALRDRRTVTRLARPSLWIAIFLVSAAAAVAFAALPGADTSVAVGLAAAARLTLRALFVVAVFSAIGRELAHPGVRRVAVRLGSRPLMDAVEAAFSTLPRAIAALPPPREVVRRPSASIAALVGELDRGLEEVAATVTRPVVVLSGPRGSGKTTVAAAVAGRLAADGLRVAGILAPGTVRDGRRWSFDVVDLATGSRRPLATRDHPSGWIDLGGFRVAPDGLAHGRRALSASAVAGADVVVVDEVGPWELDGDGWAPALDRLVDADLALVLAVRESLVDEVVGRWGLHRRAVRIPVDASPERAEDAATDTIASAVRAAPLLGTDSG